jgi:hypothetical protein
MTLALAASSPGTLAQEGQTAKVTGIIKGIDAAHLELEMPDGETLWILVGAETRYKSGKTTAKREAIQPGARATVTATFREGQVIATEVVVDGTASKPQTKPPGATPQR